VAWAAASSTRRASLSSRGFIGQILGDIEATLRQHLSGFDQAGFVDAVSLLGKARMIHAFGMGGPSSLCSEELQVRLVRLGYPIAACHDPVMMRVTAATLGPEQALIVCSLSGLTPELLDVVALARNYDTPIVAITLAASLPPAELPGLTMAGQGDQDLALPDAAGPIAGLASQSGLPDGALLGVAQQAVEQGAGARWGAVAGVGSARGRGRSRRRQIHRA